MDPTFRTAAGVRLHVLAEGDPAAPVTVVLAHGWTLDCRTWAPVARALTGPGHPGPPVRVLRYDHRGHGYSDQVARAEMTIEALADDLAELIAERAPSGPVVLAGHSMGGMTTMAMAERHPDLVRDRVAGVAFVSTAAGGLADTTLGLGARTLGVIRRGEARLARSAYVDRRDLLTRRPRLLEPGLRWLLLGRGADPEARTITACCIAGCRPGTIVGFRPTLNAHERDEALAVFAGIPTEVLVGARDRLTPLAQSRRIMAVTGHARLSIFPGAGHMLPVERVAEVSDRIADLVRLAATRGSRAPEETRRAPATPGSTSAPPPPPAAPTDRSPTSTAPPPG